MQMVSSKCWRFYSRRDFMNRMLKYRRLNGIGHSQEIFTIWWHDMGMVLVFNVKWLYVLVMSCMYVDFLRHALSIFGYAISKLGNAAESLKVSHDTSCFTDPYQPKHAQTQPALCFLLKFLQFNHYRNTQRLVFMTRLAPSCCTISMQLSHRSFGWARPYCGGVALGMFSLEGDSEMVLCWCHRTKDFSPFP